MFATLICFESSLLIKKINLTQGIHESWFCPGGIKHIPEMVLPPVLKEQELPDDFPEQALIASVGGVPPCCPPGWLLFCDCTGVPL